ncbi:MAG: hypothetical protein Q9218_007420 [Villophora microphyllina]
MEAEKKRLPRRDRRRSRPLARPEEPSEAMPFDQTSEASAPSPDTKQTIARSMSRYKGVRPKYGRSASTPSVPAMPPVLNSSEAVASKGRTRPSTTIDNLRPPSGSDDDGLPSVPQSGPPEEARAPDHRTRSPRASRRRKQGYEAKAPQHTVVDDGESAPAEPLSRELHRHRRPERSRAHDEGSHHVRQHHKGFGQDHSVAEQSKRSLAHSIRPTMVQKKSFTQKIAGFMSQPQSAAEAKAQLKQMISNPIPIEASDVPPVAQFDAPKSAVNTGERTVRVKYKDFRIPVTIVPSTTPEDIIQAVADKVGNPIHSDATVVLESFKQLGLERPLRKYEHIRDVLNSWDDDAQNTLIMEPSTTGGQDDDLDIKNVPRRQPDDSSFYLYHSQRPGHWEKRLVTLRSDGQMLVAKSNGSESSNICHLSDFDIYIPTARQISKKIRPPKRVCFAVKSQQKSNMFMSTINFVHFFSSNDKALARSLYTAVQEWRSWYLVNKMGKGIDPLNHPVTGGKGQRVPATDARRGPTTSTGALHESTRPPQTKLSDQSRQAAIAPKSHQPLHPIPYSSQLTRPGTANRRDHDRQPLPLSQPKPSSAIPACDAPFTEGGLLGRAYTQRKKGQPKIHEVTTCEVPVPEIPAFSASPIKNEMLDGLKRNSSQRRKPKPLIDLTPQYQEPPQHTRKGKGVTPGQIPAGGLVDIATSPEVAIPIPPTTSWRRPGTSSGAEVSPQRTRSHS